MLARGEAGGQLGGQIIGVLRILGIREQGGEVWEKLGVLIGNFVRE